MLTLKKEYKKFTAYVTINEFKETFSQYFVHPDNQPKVVFNKWEIIDRSFNALLNHYLDVGFSICKKEINNDIDWLNQIQENFKDG